MRVLGAVVAVSLSAAGARAQLTEAFAPEPIAAIDAGDVRHYAELLNSTTAAGQGDGPLPRVPGLGRTM